MRDRGKSISSPRAASRPHRRSAGRDRARIRRSLLFRNASRYHELPPPIDRRPIINTHTAIDDHAERVAKLDRLRNRLTNGGVADADLVADAIANLIDAKLAARDSAAEHATHGKGCSYSRGFDDAATAYAESSAACGTVPSAFVTGANDHAVPKPNANGPYTARIDTASEYWRPIVFCYADLVRELQSQLAAANNHAAPKPDANGAADGKPEPAADDNPDTVTISRADFAAIAYSVGNVYSNGYAQTLIERIKRSL